MFKREKETERAVEIEKFEKTDELSFTDRSTMDPDPKANKSVIGDQISIEGTIRGKGDLVVEGAVKGNIEVTAHHLIIGLKGQVASEIHAADVTISGNLRGNVHAKDRVAITKEAVFSGEIHAKSISVEDGAYLKAKIELAQESRKDTDSKSEFRDNLLPETGSMTPPPTDKIDNGEDPLVGAG